MPTWSLWWVYNFPSSTCHEDCSVKLPSQRTKILHYSWDRYLLARTVQTPTHLYHPDQPHQGTPCMPLMHMWCRGTQLSPFAGLLMGFRPHPFKPPLLLQLRHPTGESLVRPWWGPSQLLYLQRNNTSPQAGAIWNTKIYCKLLVTLCKCALKRLHANFYKIKWSLRISLKMHINSLRTSI